MNEDTVACGKEVILRMSGLGTHAVNVCIDCAEKYETICNTIGAPFVATPCGSEHGCEQRIVRNASTTR